MNILAIETSCDETAAAVVNDGTKELGAIVASSKELHEATGGIVPEIAARKQIEFIVPVIDQALRKFVVNAGLCKETNPQAVSQKQVLESSQKNIDAIAVTVGPGLIGSLLVGVEAAKALALAWNKPLIPVNHLVGHIYANFIVRENDPTTQNPVSLPAVALVISGGHTDLVLMRGHGDFEYIGGTLDDAAGEAYDKTARLLGLAKYLGGAELSKLAAGCKENKAQGKLPRPMMDQNNFDFSFSGLKTAVKNMIEKGNFPKDSVACEFETALTDVVISKTIRAAKKYGAKEVMMGGGVSANTYLRNRLAKETLENGIVLHVPPRDLCTDNAVYIASAAYFINKPQNFEKIIADPSLGIMD